MRTSLRAIVMSVLALPVVVQACDRATKAGDGDAGGEAGTEEDASFLPRPPLPPREAGPCDPIEADASMLFDDSGCSRYARLPCGLPPDTPLRGACIPSVQRCAEMCLTSYRCQLVPGYTCSDAGTIVPDADIYVECFDCLGAAGRRPRGLASTRRTRATSALGDYFARVSYLEAASVIAFRDVEDALLALRAPEDLCAAARRAAIDERRHAATTRRLALSFGARGGDEPVAVSSRTFSLEELLLDNAVEGCVGESFGAIVAMWQADRAEDRAIGRAMRAISGDEARHAAFSWDLLRWGAARLDPSARRRLKDRIATALAELSVEVERPVDPAVIARAGHPSVASARELAVRFEAFVVNESQRLLAA